MSADPSARPVPEDPGPTRFRRTGLTLAEARSRLSGLHFAKESLSEGEREVLAIAEGLLDLLDSESPSGFRR